MRCYFDYNATSPLLPQVHAAYLQGQPPANPSSVHSEGQRARSAIEIARKKIASILNIQRSSVVFCSGASEANAIALQTAKQAGATQHLLLATEHPSVSVTSKIFKLDSTEIPVDKHGLICLDNLANAVSSADQSPCLVSVQAVNHETGVIQPLDQVAALLPSHWLLHIDAVQAFGRIDLPAMLSRIDRSTEGITTERIMVTISGHKIGALPGVGAVCLPASVAPASLWGGGGQELRFRAGTENTIGIASLLIAAETVAEECRCASHPTRVHLKELRDLLEATISQSRGEAANTQFAGSSSPRVDNTSLLISPHLESTNAVINLDLRGFAVSAGAACSSGSVSEIASLRAMGFDSGEAKRGLRVSLGRQNTREEVIRFCQHWEQMHQR